MWTGLSSWWRRGGPRRQSARRLWLEQLEERTLLSSNTLNTALPLSFAASPVAQVSDILTTANQVNLYAVALHQGDQLTAAVNAQQQGSPLTAALRLFDSSGVELPATDSSTGGDPQLTFRIAGSGTYYLGVSSSGDVAYDPTTGGSRVNGNSTGRYALSVTDLLARFVNAAPLDNSGPVLQGMLTGGQPQDYRVTVTGDTFLLATAMPQSSPGFEPRLTLYDGTSQLLIQSDQHKPGLASATVEQHLQTGTYYLEVSAAASTSAAAGNQAYRLTTALAASLPPFAALPVGRGPASVTVADFNGDGRPDVVTANEADATVSVLLGNGDGTFQAAQSLAVGKGPQSLAVADVNGDGRPDLITANYGDNTVSVLLGNGDGTFQAAQSFAVGSAPVSVAVADLGNGHPDLVTANSADNTVSVLLGNGDGTFQPAQSFVGGSGVHSVAVADVNGDGRPDLVTANYGDNTVSVLLGNGDGTFQPAQSFAVGSEPNAVAVADLGNGHPDIVTANNGSNTVSVLLGNGDGTFQPAQSFAVGSAPYSVAVADVNGDGRPDILTSNFGGNTVSVLLGNGDGTFQAAQSFAVGSGPESVAVADVNGDGRPDLVTANYGDNAVSVLLGNGDGTFQAGQSLGVASGPRSVAVADVNGDGRPDLVTANYGNNTVSVLPGNGGTFQPAQSFAVGSEPNAVAVADLGNGRPDLVTANVGDNTVSVLLGNGDGTFQPAQSFVVGSGPNEVVVADVNGDGHPDLVTANANANTVSVLLGNGDGTFHPAQSFSVGRVPFSVAVADVNGDGRADIVTANYRDNTVSVLLGNGDGTFQPARSFAVGSGPHSVAVSDLGNGHPDLVTANKADNTVSVLLGNGDGTFQPVQALTVGSAPYSVAVADVNGDGRPDLVTANYEDNTVSVLLGNGDGTFQPAQSLAVGSAPYTVAVADLGNGHPDLVTANVGDSTVSVLLGNGGTFQPAQSLAVGKGPDAVALADLGNGHSDIVTTNFVANTVSVSLGNGDGTFQPVQTFPVGNGPDSVAVVDVNGDGRPDLVTANFGDNTVSVLLGNGDGTFQPAQSFVVGSEPASVAVADLGNGRADIITANAAADTVSVLLGNGDGTFQPAQTFAVGNDPVSVTVANLGNGHPDIVVSNSGDNTVSVLLGNGGTFQPAQSLAVGSDPVSVAVVDLGNGHPDLVTADYGANTVSVLLGNGDGTFQPAQALAVGSDPLSVAVADFGNGHPDIVTADYGDNTVSVLLGDGDGTFHPALSFAVASLPESLAVADVNDDGRRDIVTANAGTNGTTTVLLNQGNGQFQIPIANSGIPSRDVPQLEDLTGDRIPDAVSLDQQTGQILFRQGTGDPRNPFAPPIFVNPADRPATDFTLVRTQGLPEIAVLDSVDQQVFLYAWSSSARQFQEIGAFATGPQPVRIASADLDGNGLGDVVVGNDLDNTLTIAMQQSLGTFNTFTRNVGAGPSSIGFAGRNADGPPDIVVSDQVSGDVSILFNDSSHSFTTRERYRAGQNPVDVNIGPNGTTLLTQLQTVGVVAGDFTGNGTTALVALDANIHSFSLLRAAGGGSLIDPQSADTYLVAPGAIQVVAGDFLNNGREDLAVLTTAANATSQVLIFLNKGDGTFTPGQQIPANSLATGLSVVSGNGPGRFDLLVGDQFGDILRLQGNGDGTFQTPPPLTGNHVSLNVQTVNGQAEALVANQQRNHVIVEVRAPGSQAFVPKQTVVADTTLPFAPADAQFFALNENDPTLDAVVLRAAGNSVGIYRPDALTATGYVLQTSFAVGTDPVSVTIQDVNGDGIPDMLVANQGSNDVSVLFGAYDANGTWFATPGPRLKTGGSGPISVAVRDVTGRTGTGGPDGIPDLVVTNSQSGTMTVLPGVGQGFFNDTNPQTISLGGTPGTPSINADGLGVVPTADGRLVGFDLNNLAGSVHTVFTSAVAVNAVQELPGGSAVVALAGGTVEELLPDAGGNLTVATTFEPLTGIPSDPSALEVLQTASGLEVLVTNTGEDQVFVFAAPGVPEVVLPAPAESAGSVAEATPAPGAPLTLVITFVVTVLPANDQSPSGSAANEAPSAAAAQVTSVAVTQVAAATTPGRSSGEEEEEEAGQAVLPAQSEAAVDVDEELRRFNLDMPTPDGDRDGPSSHLPPAVPGTWDGVVASLAADEVLPSFPARPLTPSPDWTVAGSPTIAALAPQPLVARQLDTSGRATADAPVRSGAEGVEFPAGNGNAASAAPAGAEEPVSPAPVPSLSEQASDAVFLRLPRDGDRDLAFLIAVAVGGFVLHPGIAAFGRGCRRGRGRRPE